MVNNLSDSKLVIISWLVEYIKLLIYIKQITFLTVVNPVKTDLYLQTGFKQTIYRNTLGEIHAATGPVLG